ncbi:ESX secretion-associated protein EspG [Nocardia sp. NPDC052001]|uniref:ESX secretion-associated protein EspG n=1 Tax=Nocardia sp. NPDC052001 TaxID=3154853 RepID=UPI00343AA3C8
MASWDFTEAEFMVMWADLVQDNLPLPFLSKSKANSTAEYENERRQAREAAREKFDPGVLAMIKAVAEPDLSVALSGWDEQEPLGAAGQIRVLGARQGSMGYVVTQKPGESFWHGGGYSIRECDPVQLADELVRELPDAEAGQQGDIVLPARRDEPADTESEGITVRDWMTDSDSARSSRFFRAQTDRIGKITVTQGKSIFGPRGITEHVLRWRDIRDDGRYVITDQNPPTAAAADERRAIALINSRIAAVIRVIKEEREGLYQ